MDLLTALSGAAAALHKTNNPDIYPKDGFSQYGDLLEWMSNRTKEEMHKLFFWGVIGAGLIEDDDFAKFFGDAIRAHKKKVNTDTDHK